MAPRTDGTSANLSALLRAWGAGEADAGDRLAAVVYDDLCRLARRRLRGEAPSATLSTADLVHETYLRLIGQRTPFENRLHFFAMAAALMRRVLVDLARKRHAAKRGAAARPILLDDIDVAEAPRAVDLLALDLALGELARLDAGQARLVELRFFGGLTFEEIAEVLGVSLSTVRRDWQVARLWLFKRLGGPEGDA